MSKSEVDVRVGKLEENLAYTEKSVSELKDTVDDLTAALSKLQSELALVKRVACT